MENGPTRLCQTQGWVGPFLVFAGSVTAPPAAVPLAVVPAGVACAAVMVVTEGVGIGDELAFGEVLRRLVGGAGDAGDGEDVQRGEGLDGPGADAAADHGPDAQRPEQASQGPVALSAGGKDHGATHLTVGNVINFKRGRFSEMLENLTVLVGNGEFH